MTFQQLLVHHINSTTKSHANVYASPLRHVICDLNFNYATCTCSPRNPHCPGQLYDCNLHKFIDPPRPSDVYSCYFFVVGEVCKWIEPTCPTGQLIKWGLGTIFLQCQCGNLIEHCISYYLKPVPANSSVYPLLCNVCQFRYKVSPLKYICNLKAQFSISFFYQQKWNGSGLS